jgi:hypothetical protein
MAHANAMFSSTHNILLRYWSSSFLLCTRSPTTVTSVFVLAQTLQCAEILCRAKNKKIRNMSFATWAPLWWHVTTTLTKIVGIQFVMWLKDGRSRSCARNAPAEQEMEGLYKELGLFLGKVGTATAFVFSHLPVFHHPVALLHIQVPVQPFVTRTGMQN